MLKARAYELRLPADWPPSSVTINGVAVKQAGPTGKGGWSYQGNTLTTVIPTLSASVASRVIIEIHRAEGLMARRSELDGFAGAMTRLRGAYDALHQTWPVSDPPEALVDAMQAGDRLSYHPEHAVEEIARFNDLLPKAKAAVAAIDAAFAQHLADYTKRLTPTNWRPGDKDMDAQRQSRLDAVARARRLLDEAGK
jgi:alpha-glucosidase